MGLQHVGMALPSARKPAYCDEGQPGSEGLWNAAMQVCRGGRGKSLQFHLLPAQRGRMMDCRLNCLGSPAGFVLAGVFSKQLMPTVVAEAASP